MKPVTALLSFLPALGLLPALGSLVLDPARQQEEEQGQETEKPRKGIDTVTSVREKEVERLAREVEGSWMLMDYTDPQSLALDDVANGFATFHDGFLTLILSMDTVQTRFFGARALLVLDVGAHRYRFDEQGSLQISNVLSFSNHSENGEMEREPTGQVYEYYTKLEDGSLELRNPDGVVFTFRRVEAGEFPDLDARKLDRRRSRTPQWEEAEKEPR